MLNKHKILDRTEILNKLLMYSNEHYKQTNAIRDTLKWTDWDQYKDNSIEHKVKQETKRIYEEELDLFDKKFFIEVHALIDINRKLYFYLQDKITLKLVELSNKYQEDIYPWNKSYEGLLQNINYHILVLPTKIGDRISAAIIKIYADAKHELDNNFYDAVYKLFDPMIV
jgi:hypothetical protein